MFSLAIYRSCCITVTITALKLRLVLTCLGLVLIRARHLCVYMCGLYVCMHLQVLKCKVYKVL